MVTAGQGLRLFEQRPISAYDDQIAVRILFMISFKSLKEQAMPFLRRKTPDIDDLPRAALQDLPQPLQRYRTECLRFKGKLPLRFFQDRPMVMTIIYDLDIFFTPPQFQGGSIDIFRDRYHLIIIMVCPFQGGAMLVPLGL